MPKEMRAGKAKYLSEFGITPDQEAHAIDRVSKDLCAKCDGELDTGWECNDCGWDGRPFALMIGAPERRQ